MTEFMKNLIARTDKTNDGSGTSGDHSCELFGNSKDVFDEDDARGVRDRKEN